MDTTQFAESDYITAEIVKASVSKTLVIIGEAKPEETEYGVKLLIPVEIDAKPKKYRPNKDSIKNMQDAWGVESKKWLGKKLGLSVHSIMGKDSVIAVPKKE